MARCFESHTKEVNDVDWLDDNVFASAGNDHTIFVYHRSYDKRPTYTFKGHTDDVTRIKWSPAHLGVAPTQRLLASVSDDGNVMIWRLPAYPEDRGTHSRSLSPIKTAKDLGEDDYFQNGGAVFGSDYCVNRLAVVTGSENRRMDTVEWSPECKDGKMILAAYVELCRSPSSYHKVLRRIADWIRSGGQDCTVKLFDALSGETLYTLSGLETGTGSIAFSPTGQMVSAGGWNGQLIVWNVQVRFRPQYTPLQLYP